MRTWLPQRETLSEPLYLGISKALAADIASGRLEPGDRLPTQRELSAALGVSLGTVTRAFNEAEQRGLIKGEIGRGTFVAGGGETDLLPGIAQPQPDALDLSLNLPLYSEDPDLASALQQLARRRDLQPLLRYQPPAGTQRHRAAGAAWLTRWGFESEAGSVLLCAGAQHALTVVLATVAAPGDTVLTEELTYPGVKAAASLLHLRLEGLPMDRQGLLPEAFRAAVSRRKVAALYCIPTIQNPTAGVLSEARRREIATIAQEHDVAILEDDVHRPLLEAAPPPISHFAPERSYLVLSLGKVLAGGLRVAFLAAPPSQIDALSQAIWATAWMTAPLMAEVATTWIEDGTAERTLERKRREARARQTLLTEVFGESGYRRHPSGYHAWLELPESWTSAEFAIAARRRQVVVTPSSAFTVASSAGGGGTADGVRIGLGSAPDRERLRAGLQQLRLLLTQPSSLGPALV